MLSKEWLGRFDSSIVLLFFMDQFVVVEKGIVLVLFEFWHL